MDDTPAVTAPVEAMPAAPAAQEAVVSVVEAAAPAPAAETPAAPATPDQPTSLLAEAKSDRAAEKAPDAKPDAPVEPAKDAAAEKVEAPKADKPADAKAETKPDEAKPKDAAADAAAEKKDEAKPEEVKAPAEKPAPFAFEAFTVPEGIKLEDDRVKQFTGILDNPELNPQQRGQQLVDLYVNETKRIADQISQNQRDVWKAHNTRQVDALRADPELGGARLDTSLGVAKSVIEEFGGTDEQIAETLNALSYTGMGNNAGLVRLLHNVAQVLREGEPVMANPPSAKAQNSRAQKWYGEPNKG